MIYPIVIDPEFLKKLNDDDSMKKKTRDFFIRYKDFLTEFFILIDDKEKYLETEYNKIIKESEKYLAGSIIASELKKMKISGKKIEIDADKRSLPVENILDKLKTKNIDKIVEFPKYFNNEFIDSKKNVSKKYLVNMSYEEITNEISSITRFSKRICFIDPMIPYDLLSLNVEGRKKYPDILNVTNFKKVEYSKSLGIPRSLKIAKNYEFTLKEIINKIYENNFFKDELEFFLYTTIDDNKLFKLKNSVRSSQQKEKWDGITKMLDETVRKISPKPIRIEVKKHRIYDKETSTTDDVYDRGICALDINSCLEVRKGLDFFVPNDKKKVRNEKSYYLRMCIDDYEKKGITSVLGHEPYKREF